jgi:hypothetical protein
MSELLVGVAFEAEMNFRVLATNEGVQRCGSEEVWVW